LHSLWGSREILREGVLKYVHSAVYPLKKHQVGHVQMFIVTLTNIIAALLFMKPLSLIEVTTAILPQREQLILKHLLKL
jgi:hypothetical protein